MAVRVLDNPEGNVSQVFITWSNGLPHISHRLLSSGPSLGSCRLTNKKAVREGRFTAYRHHFRTDPHLPKSFETINNLTQYTNCRKRCQKKAYRFRRIIKLICYFVFITETSFRFFFPTLHTHRHFLFL